VLTPALLPGIRTSVAAVAAADRGLASGLMESLNTCTSTVWLEVILSRVTSRDQLKELVEMLPDEAAEELLQLARHLYAVPGPGKPLPAFIGIGDSGRTDISARVDDLLADGFGST